MDPSTTLFTFMLQTHPSVQSVLLVGSWDNFSTTYTMERDVRRDRGQWRGCHSFKDIICDGDRGLAAKRNGGLKMGQTYYYYYELDGATETYDPTVPSTTACPFLPGQKVNMLSVPSENSSRMRSASMNSLRHTDMKTMNPADKFVTPRPPPPVPAPAVARLGSAPSPLRHIRSARSLSPSPASWPWSPRRIFGRKTASSRDSEADQQFYDDNTRPSSPSDDARSASYSQGSRSRSISPESLRRFLVDDDPMVEEPAEMGDRPSVSIPDDIAEENEDDDNFATSAVSESSLYTGLSPPPLQRGTSSTTILQLPLDTPTAAVEQSPEAPTRPPPDLPMLQVPDADMDFPSSHFSISSASSLASPASPVSPGSHDLPSFYHSESEDDDAAAAAKDADDFGYPFPHLGAATGTAEDSFAQSLLSAFAGYRLPPASSFAIDARKASLHAVGSPALVARTDTELPVSNTASLLAGPASSGLDDLVSDLAWMGDLIQGKGGLV